MFQVEYYFSDSNLLEDNIMSQLATSRSEDGYVGIAYLTTFPRMAKLLSPGLYFSLKRGVFGNPAGPDVVAAIADILRRSKYLVVSFDGTKVKRKEVIFASPLEKVELLLYIF